MNIQNKRLSDDEFNRLRQEVLTQWPTGNDVDLEEAVAYHKAMPESRNFSKKLLDAKRDNRTLVQPRAGVPVVEEHPASHNFQFMRADRQVKGTVL